MKKVVSLIALIVVVSLALVACSSKGSYVEQPTTSIPTVEATVAVEEPYGPPAPEVTAEPTEIPGPDGSVG